MDVPRTPPRQSRSHVPFTPKTPKYGTFADLPDAKPKQTPVTNKQKSHFLTPRLTPHQNKKRRLSLCNQSKLEFEVRKDTSEESESDLETDEIMKNAIKPSLLNDDDDDLSDDEEHPHREHPPPNVPGMWFVFRGKKVFKPYPKGEEPIKPVRLFESQINESEEDTDVDF